MKQYLVFESSEDLDKQVPKGEKKLFRAGGKSICVVRMSSGVVAFENECPHMGEALSRGHINPFEEITCPLHAYRFSLRTGEEVSNKCSGLKFIRLQETDGKTYLEF